MMVAMENRMDANIALPAALIGDPVRAAILAALCDGRAQPASALAHAAGISPQSASNHLAKLTEGGLLSVESEGRHRYYRLASPEVAAAMEALAQVAPPLRSLDLPLTAKARSLRFGRSCYDHLAGRLGIAVTARLEALEYLRGESGSKRYAVSEAGREWFAAFGIDVAALGTSSRGVARQCLDWTERRHHLAGPLGTALLSRFVTLGWLRREHGTRAVAVTAAGAAGLAQALDLGDIDERAAMRNAS
jgi:DNA-binding transcriptional ArsR family regulator